MGIRIFLDDERIPKTEEFDIICRNSQSFFIVISGFLEMTTKIDYISFDHDLGEKSVSDAMAVVKRMVTMDMDHSILAPTFTFNVHSANPVGAENIRSYLDNYLKHKEND